MARRTLKILLGVGVAGGCVAASKRSDADVLARVGAKTAARVQAAVPDASVLAGPFAGLKPGNALSVEERVRVRIETDKGMAGARVDVLPGSAAGEVRLRGVVPTAAHRQWAVGLAEGTVGVNRVINEVAVPEQ